MPLATAILDFAAAVKVFYIKSMDNSACNIHVLLQAAEYLERREREAEHGYASILPFQGRNFSHKRSKPKPKKNPESIRTVHNELEKHRRAQLRRCLEQLKKQVPLNSDSMRNTTLNLLQHARLHIKKLQEQDEFAQRLKDKLRWEQRGLRGRLEQLLRGQERIRSDSTGSALSSERSDSDREDMEVDVESSVFVSADSESLNCSQSEGDHSYSTPSHPWL
ncbi:max dimerization protein 3 isoform X2 [Polypterus senegalus]|uniref:max dimerization protein 3 isoform X2 n=1 Tax=Polypterus senegalus TaxID=55291 RepID=UPI00196592FF|nr:max dimerization protein 3 isoform X2 [Polypterus senegalus]